MMNSPRLFLPTLRIVGGLALALIAGPHALHPGGGDALPPALRALELVRESRQVIPPQPAGHPVASVHNREAIVPPQCYTRTEAYFNPCYTCHQAAIPAART